MAVFKVVEPTESSYRDTWIAEKIHYILQPDKTRPDHYGGFNFLYVGCTTDEIIEQFYMVRNAWHKSNYISLVHYVLSLDSYWEYDITTHQLKRLVYCITKEMADDQYQVIYAIHNDTANLHAHILVNPINLITGTLLQTSKGYFYELQNNVEFYLKCYHFWRGNRPLKLIR